MAKITLDTHSGRSAQRLCPYRRDFCLAPAKVLCPCHRVDLLVGFILALHPAIQIVAAGMGKQHDGDLCYWSRRPPPRRCLIRATTNRASTKKYGRRRRDACYSGRTGMSRPLRPFCAHAYAARQGQPPLFLRVPPGAPRPHNPVYPHATCQRCPSSSHPPPKALRPNLPPANVSETETTTR
ncbi:hypothetical protein EDB83DRAFT_438398 [Lactarius deliciosus]|nr:hypothetical protein EDB83DRAFT_438398 [Lactarius deliciosus]